MTVPSAGRSAPAARVRRRCASACQGASCPDWLGLFLGECVQMEPISSLEPADGAWSLHEVCCRPLALQFCVSLSKTWNRAVSVETPHPFQAHHPPDKQDLEACSFSRHASVETPHPFQAHHPRDKQDLEACSFSRNASPLPSKSPPDKQNLESCSFQSKRLTPSKHITPLISKTWKHAVSVETPHPFQANHPPISKTWNHAVFSRNASPLPSTSPPR